MSYLLNMMDNWWKLVIPWEFHVETACKIYSFDFLKEIDLNIFYKPFHVETACKIYSFDFLKEINLTDERYCCGDIAAHCEQFAGMFDSFLVIK